MYLYRLDNLCSELMMQDYCSINSMVFISVLLIIAVSKTQILRLLFK